MGLLDALLGRTKPVRANLDALFALPSAAITLQSSAGASSSGRAGVCWKAPAAQSAAEAQQEIKDLLAIDDTDSGAMTQTEDRFGYRWLVISDPAIEDLVTRVHVVNSTLAEAGWDQQLLCSVFGFGSFSLVYLYKRGTFYPFAPIGPEKRDNELELRIQALVGSDLPFEQDLTRWFPLWDMPV